MIEQFTAADTLRPSVRDYQRDIILALRDLPYAAFFAEMGTGKSLMAIETMEHWYRLGLRRFVFVCPNALTGTIEGEFQKWESPLKVVRFRESGRKARTAVIRSEWDVLIVNYEATRTLWQEICRMRPQGFVGDEFQSLKHRRSGQTKACRLIAEATKICGGRTLGMTGTPITKNILDLWSECDVLSPARAPSGHPLGMGSYNAFEQQVSIVVPHPRLGMRAKTNVFPPERTEPVIARLSQFARIARKEDVLKELPDRVYSQLVVDLLPEQARIYRALSREMVATIEQTDLDASSQEVLNSVGLHRTNRDRLIDPLSGLISAPMAITLLMRLQQVASGFVKTDDGVTHTLPSAKLELVKSMVEEWTDASDGRKLVIFARFRHDINILVKTLTEMGLGVARLDGETSKHASEIVHQFQTDEGIRVFVGNTQVAGTGITLTAAQTALFFSNGFMYGDRIQAESRIHRIGQTRTVNYFDIIAAKTIDVKVLANLAEKHDAAVGTIAALKSMIEAQ